jgi:hypothetical protein
MYPFQGVTLTKSKSYANGPPMRKDASFSDGEEGGKRGVCRSLHTIGARTVLEKGHVRRAAGVPQIGETAVDPPPALWQAGPRQGERLATVSRSAAVVVCVGTSNSCMSPRQDGHQGELVHPGRPCLTRQDGPGTAIRIWCECGEGVGTHKSPSLPCGRNEGQVLAVRESQ